MSCIKMRSKATAKLLAQTDLTCEFLMNFFSKHPESSHNGLREHIEIDPDLLTSKIDLLKEAGLISNHTVLDEDGKVVIDRLFSLTREGKKSLIELGYNIP